MHVVQIVPPAPAPPIPPIPQIPPLPVVEMTQGPAVAGVTASPSEVLQAFEAQRDELRSQLNKLASERLAIARRLREGEVSGVDKAGLESRIQSLDTRMLEVSNSLAAADLKVATQKGVPGAYVPPYREGSDAPPPEMLSWMAFSLVAVILIPASIAFARRIWRRGAPQPPATLSPEIDERLSRMEQAIDAVAVEVERVGEGQRYVTRVLGAGKAEPIVARAAERVEVPR